MAASANRIRLVSVASAALSLCAALAGCVTLDPLLKKHDTPPIGQVMQIAVTWDKAVAFVPDFTRAGAMNPGLLCRMYLFGAEVAFPLAGDGTVSVDLYDDTPLTSGGKSVLKERWNFDKDTLKGCIRKDTVGWGYTLFLPWGTYSSEIRQVHMMVQYTPHQGVPFYSPSQTMNLIHPASDGAQLARQGSQQEIHGTQLVRTGSPTNELTPGKR